MIALIRNRLRRSFTTWIEKRLPLQRSVTLNQSRIVIVPTRQGLILLVVALLILLLAINFESSLNFALAFWLISMLWVAIYLTYRNLSGLTISAEAGSLVEVGDMAEVTLVLSSSGKTRRGVIELINEQWGVVQVSANESSTVVRIPLPAEFRGPVSPPRFRIESRFPFGLIVAWSHLKIDAKAWAYPKAIKLDRFTTGSGSEDDQESMDDHFYHPGNEDFHSLKGYVPGDSIHRLHWPSFSKDQLVVKAFTDYQSSDECVDWDQFPGVATESRLSAMAYYSELLFERNEPFAIKLPGVEVEANKGPEHLTRVRRALAEFGYD